MLSRGPGLFVGCSAHRDTSRRKPRPHDIGFYCSEQILDRKSPPSLPSPPFVRCAPLKAAPRGCAKCMPENALSPTKHCSRESAGRERRARAPASLWTVQSCEKAHGSHPAQNPGNSPQPRATDPPRSQEEATMAKGLKKKSDLELTTAERAAVLRAIAELDGKSSQKAVRKSAESILGAPEGSLDAKKAAIKEVCQEEMNRLEQQKPPKKQKRKKATLGAEGAGEADDDAPAEYVPKKPKVKPVSKDGQAERTGKFSKAESAEVMQAAEDEAKSRGVTVSQMVEKSDWGRGDKNPWRSIAEKFPQRSARSILGHVKRNGHSGAKQKGVRWTVGESQALKEAFDKNPSDWTQIAQGFDRTPGACRDRYRTLFGEVPAKVRDSGALHFKVTPSPPRRVDGVVVVARGDDARDVTVDPTQGTPHSAKEVESGNWGADEDNRLGTASRRTAGRSASADPKPLVFLTSRAVKLGRACSAAAAGGVVGPRRRLPKSSIPRRRS